MFWLLHFYGYLNGRHTLPLQVLLFAMLGLAIPMWGELVRGNSRRRHLASGHRLHS